MAPDCGNIIAGPFAVHGRVSQTWPWPSRSMAVIWRRRERRPVTCAMAARACRQERRWVRPRRRTHGKCPSADRAHAHPTSRPKLEYRVGPISGLYLVLDSVEFERSLCSAVWCLFAQCCNQVRMSRCWQSRNVAWRWGRPQRERPIGRQLVGIAQPDRVRFSQAPLG